MTNAAYLKVIRQYRQRLQLEYDRARKLLDRISRSDAPAIHRPRPTTHLPPPNSPINEGVL